MSRHRTAALVGNPNAGKSALFNALTGARQKIANYPGVTVERKSGRLILPSGEPMELTDLPGSYGLNPTSPDEEVTRDVVLGLRPGGSEGDDPNAVARAFVRQSHGPRTLELLLRYRTQAVGELGRLLRLLADLRGAAVAQPPLVASARVEAAANDNRPAIAPSRCHPLAPGLDD